jgi:hypothetical protein
LQSRQQLEEMLAEIKDLIEGFNQPTFRGIRINGRRVQTWSSHRRMSVCIRLAFARLQVSTLLTFD